MGYILWGRGGGLYIRGGEVSLKVGGVIRWGRDVGYNKCSQDVLLINYIIVNITSH